ncbi:MAG TPA: hypothetical protein VMN37_10550 [Gemmatimonadales bacterium]|nr:hypothetical protein [Gemmatimonadales bacterium]
MTLAPFLALLLAATGPAPAAAADTVRVGPGRGAEADTLRAKAVVRTARKRRAPEAIGALVPGYLSPRGLPPRAGQFVITDTGLVFLSVDGRLRETYPLVGPVREVGGRRWRASTVTLAYVDLAASRALYVFRLDGGVFQTESPGPLLEVVDRPEWVDRTASRELFPDRPLVSARDEAALRELTTRIARGAYADTLYALFGRPARPAGRVGERGRAAGRLGEYLANRDSLALDPARMTSEEQLRHTLAHELGHRWQARAPGQLALLWRGIPPVPDPRRYGHGSVTEHQAEAIAFAVHFLQTTAAAPAGGDVGPVLEQYDRMVPGTRLMARYLALQPIYARHPLRAALTQGRPRQP